MCAHYLVKAPIECMAWSAAAGCSAV